MQAFCKDVQHGHAKVIRCLEDNLEQPTFNATCKAEIQKHAANSATDYRWGGWSSVLWVAFEIPVVVWTVRLSPGGVFASALCCVTSVAPSAVQTGLWVIVACRDEHRES